MISAASLEVVGFSPFAAGTGDGALIPAQMVARRIANVTGYNTSLSAELRNDLRRLRRLTAHAAAATKSPRPTRCSGAAVRRERWNTTR